MNIIYVLIIIQLHIDTAVVIKLSFSTNCYNEYQAKAEKLVSLDAQSRAEEESLAKPEHDQVIRLKVFNVSAIMLSVKDVIDMRSVIGVNLHVRIGKHNFALKRYCQIIYKIMNTWS